MRVYHLNAVSNVPFVFIYDSTSSVSPAQTIQAHKATQEVCFHQRISWKPKFREGQLFEWMCT